MGKEQIMNYNDTEINATEESSIADISLKQAEVADCYEQHKRAFDRWRFGKPVKSWKGD